MLRAVLVGLLSVSAVACKSGGDSPASQPGAAAGKVLEVSGTVTVRHNDVARPLAKGETVDADDIVETGGDGTVIIELAHNLARWELGANRTSKVRESAAWSLAKKSGEVATVEQDSAAAGRHAERSAAETGVSASAERAKAEPAPAAAPPPGAPPAPRTPAPVAPVAPAAEVAAAPAEKAMAASPPPPAPQPETTRRRAAAPADTAGLGAVGTIAKGGGGASGGAAASTTADLEAAPAPLSPAEADKAAMDVVLASEKSIKACLTKETQAVNVTIKVAANGTATAIVSGTADVPASVQRCVKAAVAKMKFAKAATTVKLEVAR